MTANENQIVVYQPNETVRLKVWLENEVKTKEPPLQSIFYQNKFWDAKSLFFGAFRRWEPRSSPGFLNQSARRCRNGENTAKARRCKICYNCDASKGEGFGIICARKVS